MEMTRQRRTLLLRLGIAAAVFVVLVVIPGCVAIQPAFMEKYANTADRVTTWSESVHANVTCHECHVPPGIGSQVGYRARMVGEFYVSIVSRDREPEILERPTTEACERCHIDLRTVSPDGDLDIPHRAHVDILEIACVDCHEFLVHELSPEGTHTPRMVACLDCHDGEQASNACADCHTDKATPDSHQAADWAIVHPERQDTEDCESCHGWVEDWCVECHERRPQSHVELWRSEHRYTVETRRNCESCHTAEHCIECHGVVPALNFDPTVEIVE